MKKLLETISKDEWRFVFWLAIILVILTGIPYLFAYLMTKDGMVYNGIHALSPGDVAVYYSYINQIKDGHYFFKDLFTSEPQSLATFNVWWFLVGWLARFFNLSVVFAFQLSRLLMIPVLVITAYLFISYFFIEKIKRKTAAIFLFFSSGLGFYFAPFVPSFFSDQSTTMWWPTDLWISESITFNAIYQSSHFIASLVCTLLIFLLMLLAFEKKIFLYSVLTGLLTLFYLNFHPYYAPVVYGVLGFYVLYLFFKEKKILWLPVFYLIILFLISFPSVAYHYWLIAKSPVISLRSLQNVTLISPFIFVLAGYGFLVVGAIIGLIFLIKNKQIEDKFIFLFLWLSVNIFLIYSPFPFHSRYTQGLHVVLVIFTVYGLFSLKNYLFLKLSPDRYKWLASHKLFWPIFFVPLFFLSILFLIGRDYYYFSTQLPKTGEYLYISNDVMEAYKWLDCQESGKIILAADFTAKFIPGFSGQTVYTGHGQETLFFLTKNFWLNWFFYNDEQSESKKTFLIKNNIDYVFFGKHEKELGSFTPADKDYLELVFDSLNAKIYRVNDSESVKQTD